MNKVRGYCSRGTIICNHEMQGHFELVVLEERPIDGAAPGKTTLLRAAVCMTEKEFRQFLTDAAKILPHSEPEVRLDFSAPRGPHE